MLFRSYWAKGLHKGRPITKTVPRVSIVIPCFNAAATLGATIASGLAQGQSDVEIVVVDDGSNDSSLAVARAFEPAVKVLTGPNRGVSAARNRGIAETSGEWIVFLDADDLLAPGTIAARLARAEKNDADVVVCDWREFSGADSNAVSGTLKSVDVKALASNAEIACATHVWATTCALMYRRTVVDKIGGFRGDLPVIQDARFLFDAAYHGAKFAYFHHDGAYYRVLAGSLSRRDPAKFWRDVFLNGKQIEALWRNRNPLSQEQFDALGQIYNGAAHGLFAARDTMFLDAVSSLRSLGLPVDWRNRIAAFLSRTAGFSAALCAASLWSNLYRLIRRPRLRDDATLS